MFEEATSCFVSNQKHHSDATMVSPPTRRPAPGGASSTWDDHAQLHLPSSYVQHAQHQHQHQDFGMDHAFHARLSQPPSFDQQSQYNGNGNGNGNGMIPAPAPAPPSRRRKKAKNHRRRHVPVGPAGVWFQTHQQQQQQQQNQQTPVSGQSLSTRKQSSNNQDNDDADDDADDDDDDDNDENGILTSSARPTAAAGGGVNFYSNAWMCMQCQLDLITPSLPTYLSAVQERYTAVRQHVPDNYMLLAEILQGKADWKVPVGVSVLVLVHTIQSLADHLWTVELMDETGCKITAWIQPSLVQAEQQRQVPAYIRPGLVWLLEEATIQLVSRENMQEDEPDSDDDETEEPTAVPTATTDNANQESSSTIKMDRLLLVSERNIRRVWTPEQAEKDVSDQDYLAWMERRNSLTASATVAANGPGNTHASNDGNTGNAGIRNRNGRMTREESDPDDDSDEEEFTFEELPPPPPPPAPVSRSNDAEDVAPRIHSLHAARSPPTAATAAAAATANSQANARDRAPSQSASSTPHAAISQPERERTRAPSQSISSTSKVTATGPRERETTRAPISKGVPLRTSPGPTSQSQVPANTARADFRQFAASPATAATANQASDTATSLAARRPLSPPPQFQQSPRPVPANLQQFNASTPVNDPPSNAKQQLSQQPSHSLTTSDQPFCSPAPLQQHIETKKSAPKRTPNSARTTSSKKKKRKKSIPAKATTTTTTTASPKAPSNLFSTADASLLDMFEDDTDDDDDNDNIRAPPLADPVVPATSVPESSTAIASQEPADPAATEVKSSLFQAANFAGMDMDLFSDDDEDD